MYIQKDTVSNTHNFASHGSCNFPHTLYGMANVRAKRKRLNLPFESRKEKDKYFDGHPPRNKGQKASSVWAN